MKFKMQKERSLYIALLVALLAMLALSGAYAQGAGVQDLKALRVENWINVGTDLSVGGNSSITGNETVGGTLGVTGVLSAAGFANSNYLSVSAPTAIASATPAIRINNLGAGNDAVSVEKASTPVFKIGNSGAVTGKVLQYNAASGQAQICGTTTITGTGTLAHGLATPSYVQVSLGQDATGDGATLSFTNASKTVTAKVWNTALTPAAATTPVAVDWCVIGTP